MYMKLIKISKILFLNFQKPIGTFMNFPGPEYYRIKTMTCRINFYFIY